MLKRGQVTIFIILGIVVVVAVVFGIALRKDIAKAVKGTETKETMSFQEQAGEVKKHVEDCLEKALLDARNQQPALRQYMLPEQYNEELAAAIKQRFEACLGFRQFEGLEITEGDIIGVETSTNNARTERSAVAHLDVTIKKGSDSASFSEFEASVSNVI